MKENREALDDALANMFAVSSQYSTNYLFYAHMISQCSIKVDNDLPAPAGVAFNIDHYDLYINNNEFAKMELVQRLGVLKHEMLHLLHGHLLRDGMMGGKDSTISIKGKINEVLNGKDDDYIEELSKRNFKNVNEMYQYVKK